MNDVNHCLSKTLVDRYGEKVQDTLITHGRILDYWLFSSSLLVVDCQVVAKLRLLVKTNETIVSN